MSLVERSDGGNDSEGLGGLERSRELSWRGRKGGQAESQFHVSTELVCLTSETGWHREVGREGEGGEREGGGGGGGGVEGGGPFAHDMHVTAHISDLVLQPKFREKAHQHSSGGDGECAGVDRGEVRGGGGGAKDLREDGHRHKEILGLSNVTSTGDAGGGSGGSGRERRSSRTSSLEALMRELPAPGLADATPSFGERSPANLEEEEFGLKVE